MSDAPIIIAVRCFDCGAQVTPSEVVRVGESVIQCWKCYERERTVINSWADPPKECALCHAQFDELARQCPGQPVSMFLHLMDGAYGLLCSTCDPIYVRKRVDQFRGTRYGDELKL